jgi:hypothetical protein
MQVTATDDWMPRPLIPNAKAKPERETCWQQNGGLARAIARAGHSDELRSVALGASGVGGPRIRGPNTQVWERATTRGGNFEPASDRPHIRVQDCGSRKDSATAVSIVISWHCVGIAAVPMVEIAHAEALLRCAGRRLGGEARTFDPSSRSRKQSTMQRSRNADRLRVVPV